MRKLLLSFLMLIAIVSVNAQSISVTSNGFVYTQNFNSLPSSGTSAKSVLPNGWYTYFNPGGSAKDSIQTTAGSATAAGFYSVGAAANSERALGTLISNANAPMYIGVKCVNNTGSTITAVQISYKMEQWRRGNNTAAHPDTLIAEYNVGSDSIHTGTWTVGLGLSAVSINSTATVGSLDGNTISQTVSTTLSSLNIPNGATFWLRFNDYNIFGNDDILAVDDLSATFTTGSLPACTTPTGIPTTMSFTNITATSAKVTYNNATPKPDGYAAFIGTVKVGGNPSTFNGTSFVEGNSYTLSSNSYKCINFDSDTTMTASGLTANTKYYVLVTSFNNACTGGPNYATSYKVDSFTTQQLSTDCTQPSSSTGFVKTDSTNTTISVKWTNPTNADSVMVLIAPSTVGFVTVRDSATYPVNSTITSSNGVLATVKYRGTDSSFVFTGLTAATYYKIFIVPFNNKNCTNGPNYGSVNAKNFATAGGVPNTDCAQPSGVSNLRLDSTATTITVRYTLPTADSVMILYAPISVGFITIRDSAYYAVGSTIASSNATPATVAYRGKDSSFTITGLTLNTVYKVFVVTFNNKNCTNGPNYANPATKTVKTASVNGTDCTQPSGVTNLRLDSTATTITVRYTLPTADSVMILYAPISVGFITIRDSAYYAVGSTIASSNATPATVAYRGTDSVFTITGLSASTVYKIFVVTFNNKSCTNGPNYANPATKTVKTFVTSVRNNTNQVALRLFPNPTTNILNLEFEKNAVGNTNVTIFDNVGRNVYSNSYNINNQLQINLPSLAKGIYIINLENKDFTAVKTFIVE